MSDKLNIAVCGTAHQADYNLKELAKTNMVNLVAVVDVDDRFLTAASHAYPKARRYHDYRDMLEQQDVDAVLVAIPDHMHAWVTLAALRAGKHVYCEKPSMHSAEEVRLRRRPRPRTNASRRWARRSTPATTIAG